MYRTQAAEFCRIKFIATHFNHISMTELDVVFKKKEKEKKRGGKPFKKEL